MARNKFATRCCCCECEVAGGEGFLQGKSPSTGFWQVMCESCRAALGDVRGWRAGPAPPPRSTPPRVPGCLARLGLMPPVTPDQVKQRYRMLAMRHHPDRGGDAAAFVLVNDAYREALSLARPRG